MPLFFASPKRACGLIGIFQIYKDLLVGSSRVMDLFKLECSTPGLSAEKKVSLLQEDNLYL